MSILSKEQFFNKINERIGNDTSDEAVAFLEDMADTYNSLVSNSSANEAESWKRKYEENDAAWKKKYTHRFFSGGEMNYSPYKEDDDSDANRENITIDELFEKETKR